MAYAFDENDALLDAPLTREEIETELAEWQSRLKFLMDQLESWVPDGSRFKAIRRNTYQSEPTMRAAGITGTRPFPSLTVDRVDLADQAHRPMMHVNADARWVLFTRGRLLVFHPKGMTYIEDHGGQDQPNWLIYPHRDLFRSVPFNHDEFSILLDGLL